MELSFEHELVEDTVQDEHCSDRSARRRVGILAPHTCPTGTAVTISLVFAKFFINKQKC